MDSDTIAAIATPPGEGGLAVIRLSGPEASSIAQTLFRPHRPGPLRPYRVRYGTIHDPTTGTKIDEALVTLMRAPYSFTREDVVELSVHGGALPAQTTLRLVLAAGARLARPGEFTLRAFLNGRIDLSQAEATLDVIRAQTDAALQLAQAQLSGWLAREVRAARMALLEALAYVTVIVDFPEDEVEAQDIGPQLRAGLSTIDTLLRGANQGMVYRQGARVALVGRPNVGKSSLLNRLLRSERAIVTAIPGTTRDTLEETANLDGIPVVLVDTAGIHASSDPVEQLGIARSREALAGADLVLLVLDASVAPSHDDAAIAALADERPTLVVWNKLDALSDGTLPALPTPPRHMLGMVAVSAQRGDGMRDLVTAISSALLGGNPAANATAHLVSNPRHHDALHRAHEHLSAVATGWERGHPTDLLGGDLTAALNALGEITGETVGDDLLDVIFSRFCIGK